MIKKQARILKTNIQKLYSRYQSHEVSAAGAQLAYYLLLSFFPFLLLLMTLIGYSPVSRDEVLNVIGEFLPNDTFAIIQDTVVRETVGRANGFLSLGIITALWAASTGAGAVISGLNRAYGDKEARPFWIVKAEALVFTAAFAGIILFSFVFMIFGRHIGTYLFIWMGLSETFFLTWDIIRYLGTSLAAIFVFMMLYHYAPVRRVTWREIMPGAFFTAFSWLGSSLGFAWYVNNLANYSKIYGSIGGIIVLLIWLYISAMAILMGGELNAVLVEKKDHKN